MSNLSNDQLYAAIRTLTALRLETPSHDDRGILEDATHIIEDEIIRRTVNRIETR